MPPEGRFPRRPFRVSHHVPGGGVRSRAPREAGLGRPSSRSLPSAGRRTSRQTESCSRTMARSSTRFYRWQLEALARLAPLRSSRCSSRPSPGREDRRCDRRRSGRVAPGSVRVVVVPSRVLMEQWHGRLTAALPEARIGRLGDSDKDLPGSCDGSSRLGTRGGVQAGADCWCRRAAHRPTSATAWVEQRCVGRCCASTTNGSA